MSENIPNPAIYRGAADVVREIGWTQGDYCREDFCNDEIVGCCTAGAIRMAANGYPSNSSPETDTAEFWLVSRVLGAEYLEAACGGEGGYGESVGRWNDKPGRTVDEVLDALERAAVAAESARAEAAQDGGA